RPVLDQLRVPVQFCVPTKWFCRSDCGSRLSGCHRQVQRPDGESRTCGSSPRCLPLPWVCVSRLSSKLGSDQLERRRERNAAGELWPLPAIGVRHWDRAESQHHNSIWLLSSVYRRAQQVSNWRRQSEALRANRRIPAAQSLNMPRNRTIAVASGKGG